MQKIKCPHCDKEYSKMGLGTHIWRTHGEGVSFSSNHNLKNGSRDVWNKGKTKENNSSIKKMSEKLTGKKYPNRKPVSDTARENMRIAYRLKKENGTNQTWNSRNIKSYAEIFFESVIFNNNLSDYCEREYMINVEDKRYFLDFYFNNKKIDLEIDGHQHRFRKDHDIERDLKLNSIGIQVYRIEWKDINSDEGKLYMKREIDNFINFYNNAGLL